MSPAGLLTALIMAPFGYIWKILAVTIPLFGALHVVFIIFNDEILSQHIALTLSVTALFSFTCCLLTLSKICVLQRKQHAENKPIEQLWDSDLKYENETDEVPHYKLSYHCKDILSTLKNLIYKNPLEFCKFRPAYGMFLLTGFFYNFAFFAALSQVKEWNNKDDFYCVALELTVPMILLISIIYFIANAGLYTASKNSDRYFPFEEFVQIPMKILIGKTVAVFVTSGGTYSLLVLFMLSLLALSGVSSNYLFHSSEISDALKKLLPAIYPDPQKFLRNVLVITVVVCVNALIGMIVSAFIEARKSILCIIERNWHRNLGAISFLLEDTEANTLADLKAALDHKRIQPLTEKEIAAFKYISWPIWRSKQPFMLRKCPREPLEESESVENNEPSEPDEPENIHATAELEQKPAAQSSQILAQEVTGAAKSEDSSQIAEAAQYDKPSTSA